MWVKKWFILCHHKFKFKSDVYTGLKTDLVTTYKNLSQRQKNLLQRQTNCHNIKKNVAQITSRNALQEVVTSRHKIFLHKKLVIFYKKSS